jgi:hypothetical protein
MSPPEPWCASTLRREASPAEPSPSIAGEHALEQLGDGIRAPPLGQRPCAERGGPHRLRRQHAADLLLHDCQLRHAEAEPAAVLVDENAEPAFARHALHHGLVEAGVLAAQAARALDAAELRQHATRAVLQHALLVGEENVHGRRCPLLDDV